MQPDDTMISASKRKAQIRRGFMTRLAHDTRGNTLMLAGAALLPICAAIGGGVDMSRAYLAKARLSEACDAAALAGRRAMTNEDVATAEPEAKKFFNFNFPQGTMETDPFEIKVTRPDTGVIKVTAATNVPTSIMRVFGYKKLPISVECDATQNFNNIDIVLVLDVTGSMDESVSGVKKIVSLRTAVMALYDELATAQTQLATQGLRLRYGIVPYSATVNVGYLVRAKDESYIATSHKYQSRVAKWGTETYIDHYDTSTSSSSSSSTVGPVTTTKNNKRNACNALNGVTVSGPTTTTSGNTKTTNTITTTVIATHSTTSGNNNGTCTIKTTTKTDTTTEVTTSTPVYATRPLFLNWEYGPTDSYDTALAQYVTGASATTATGSSGTNVNSTWNGCIEERQTTSAITASGGSGTSDIPSNAWDLNINMIPTSDQNSKWAAQWSRITYQPKLPNPSTENSSNYGASCPAEARKLAEMTRTEMDDYTKTLSPIGSTYLDIGMIWGARFISSGGIFGDENPTSYLKSGASGTPQPVSKYIIFMTDGIMDPSSTTYAAYGVETLAQRINGGTYNTNVADGNPSDLKSRHERRFKMACSGAKSVGATIFTVEFATGSSASALMKACTGSDDRALFSANGTGLTNTFKQIGKQIGALRLAK